MKPKRMVLTSRDKELISLIASFGILTTQQIAQQIFKGVRLTTVLRRLRALEASGYLLKTVSTVSFDRCWYVTPKTKEVFGLEAAKLNFPKAIIEHDLMLSSLRLHLEELGIARSWIPEHEIRRKVVSRHGLERSKRRVIPDGIMGVERGTKESVAIELELTTKNQSRYKEIFSDYAEKKNLLAVWYLVPNQSAARQIFKARKESYLGNQGPWLWISEIGDVLKNGELAKISGLTKTFLLHEMFDANPPKKPAHPPAQQVSTEIKKAEVIESKLSTENKTQTLVPTG